MHCCPNSSDYPLGEGARQLFDLYSDDGGNGHSNSAADDGGATQLNGAGNASLFVNASEALLSALARGGNGS
eukprot:SAG11_NODE_30411_length_301_cov_0.767327_1_plen_71_part_10